ncbi:MAG: oxidoreductase [Pseudonocardiaceae bacterium]|nr:oxidoreductase [Pseudonocardiaceae bacterium]
MRTSLRLGGDVWINRLGYGAMRLCGPQFWGEPADREHAIAVLRRAVELGVDFFDTAEAYGPHTNEEIVGAALRPYDHVVIATKGGGVRPSPEEWEALGKPGFIRQGVETSLRRLGLECLDLYQLHRVDPEVPLAETLGALDDLRQAGKIRHIGLSEVDVETIEAARKIVPVVAVQNRYSLVDRHWDDVVDYCQAEGMAFIAWSPTGGGNYRALAEAVARAGGLAGVGSTQVALAWLLRRTSTTVAIPGTTSLQHLAENVAAADVSLTDEQYLQLTRLPQASMSRQP